MDFRLEHERVNDRAIRIRLHGAKSTEGQRLLGEFVIADFDWIVFRRVFEVMRDNDPDLKIAFSVKGISGGVRNMHDGLGTLRELMERRQDELGVVEESDEA